MTKQAEVKRKPTAEEITARQRNRYNAMSREAHSRYQAKRKAKARRQYARAEDAMERARVEKDAAGERVARTEMGRAQGYFHYTRQASK